MMRLLPAIHRGPLQTCLRLQMFLASSRVAQKAFMAEQRLPYSALPRSSLDGALRQLLAQVQQSKGDVAGAISIREGNTAEFYKVGGNCAMPSLPGCLSS